MLASKACVLGGEDSLHDNRHAVAGEPLEVAPAETRVEVPAEEVTGDGEMLGNLEIDPEVALSPTEIRRVDRKHERGEIVLDRFGDQVFGLRAIGEDVDLKPARRPRSRSSHLGGPSRRRGREAHDRAGRGRRARGGELTVGMRHALQRERRDQDRQRDVGPKDGRRGRDRPDVDEHARPELATLERGEVVPERDLVPSAADEVRVCVFIEHLFGELLVVPDVNWGRHAASVSGCRTRGAIGCG